MKIRGQNDMMILLKRLKIVSYQRRQRGPQEEQVFQQEPVQRLCSSPCYTAQYHILYPLSRHREYWVVGRTTDCRMQGRVCYVTRGRTSSSCHQSPWKFHSLRRGLPFQIHWRWSVLESGQRSGRRPDTAKPRQEWGVLRLFANSRKRCVRPRK